MFEKLMRVPEAAKALGMSPITLAKWRMSGTGPAYVRLGRNIAYRPEDLEAWFIAQTRVSTSEEVCSSHP